MSEVWKPIVGYENVYEVSDHGNIKRTLKSRGTPTGNLLKATICQTGYYTASLSLHSRIKTFKVHKLVAEAFLGIRPENVQINHKDGNKLNNHIDNLEYVTKQENMDHYFRVLGSKYKGRKGEPRNRLSDEQVREIRQQCAEGRSRRSLAKIFDCSVATIQDIVAMRSRKNVLS